MKPLSELFILSHDKRLKTFVQFQIPNFLNIKNELDKGNYSKLKDASVIIIPTSEYGLYPDIYDTQLFLFSENLFKSVQLFLPNKMYYTFYTMDKVKKIMKKYYHIPLPQIINNHSSYDTLFHEMKTVNRHIVQTNIENKLSTIVSLEFAETILRCNPTHIHLKRLYLEE